MDKALQTSLASSLGVDTEIEYSWRFPPNGKPYKLAGACWAGGKVENIPEARQKVLAAMTPPTKHQAEEWLAMLQVATAGARKSEAGSMLTLELYAGALTRFPADVAMKACEELAISCSWFPTLGEIVAACERLAAPRQALLAGLSK